MATGLHVGFQLDRRWHWLRGEMDETKKPALLSLAQVLDRAGVAYVIIGGMAMQVHRQEPRTTLDIDVAVADRAKLPASELMAAGFRRTGAFTHSENWVGAGETPVQFTDDPSLRDALARPLLVVLEGVTLPFLAKDDLLHAKLRAAADGAQRRSKRLQDLADAHALVEEEPELAGALSEGERRLLERGA